MIIKWIRINKYNKKDNNNKEVCLKALFLNRKSIICKILLNVFIVKTSSILSMILKKYTIYMIVVIWYVKSAFLNKLQIHLWKNKETYSVKRVVYL